MIDAEIENCKGDPAHLQHCNHLRYSVNEWEKARRQHRRSGFEAAVLRARYLEIRYPHLDEDQAYALHAATIFLESKNDIYLTDAQLDLAAALAHRSAGSRRELSEALLNVRAAFSDVEYGSLTPGQLDLAAALAPDWAGTSEELRDTVLRPDLQSQR